MVSSPGPGAENRRRRAGSRSSRSGLRCGVRGAGRRAAIAGRCPGGRGRRRAPGPGPAMSQGAGRRAGPATQAPSSFGGPSQGSDAFHFLDFSTQQDASQAFGAFPEFSFTQVFPSSGRHCALAARGGRARARAGADGSGLASFLCRTWGRDPHGTKMRLKRPPRQLYAPADSLSLRSRRYLRALGAGLLCCCVPHSQAADLSQT